MNQSRHLVDPQIIEMLDMPSLDLTDEALPEIRANRGGSRLAATPRARLT